MRARSDRRRWLYFTLVFPVLLGVSVAVYTWVLPGYSRAVAALTNPLLDDLPRPLRIEVGDRGDLITFVREPGGSWRRLYDEAYYPHAVFLSLILFPAMLLATPMALRRRLPSLLAGLAVLYIIHSLSVYALFRTHQCLAFDADSFSCDWIKGIVLTGGQVGAFVLWGAFTWTHWFPSHVGPAPIVEPVGRNAPCPCGSGRKYKHCCGGTPG